MGKGDNAGKQHFLLFHNVSQKASFLGVSQVIIVHEGKARMIMNSLRNHNIFDWTKLKAFADDNLVVAK